MLSPAAAIGFLPVGHKRGHTHRQNNQAPCTATEKTHCARSGKPAPRPPPPAFAWPPCTLQRVSRSLRCSSNATHLWVAEAWLATFTTAAHVAAHVATVRSTERLCWTTATHTSITSHYALTRCNTDAPIATIDLNQRTQWEAEKEHLVLVSKQWLMHHQ